MALSLLRELVAALLDVLAGDDDVRLMGAKPDLALGCAEVGI